MKYSVWVDTNDNFTFIPGVVYTADDVADMRMVHVIEASCWDEACVQYHKWQGWEPYKPMSTTVGV